MPPIVPAAALKDIVAVLERFTAADRAQPAEVTTATEVSEAVGRLHFPDGSIVRWRFIGGALKILGVGQIVLLDTNHGGRSLELSPQVCRLRGWAENWDNITDWRTTLNGRELALLLAAPRLIADVLPSERDWEVTNYLREWLPQRRLSANDYSGGTS